MIWEHSSWAQGIRNKEGGYSATTGQDWKSCRRRPAIQNKEGGLLKGGYFEFCICVKSINLTWLEFLDRYHGLVVWFFRGKLTVMSVGAANFFLNAPTRRKREDYNQK